LAIALPIAIGTQASSSGKSHRAVSAHDGYWDTDRVFRQQNRKFAYFDQQKILE
jgi:hypothetical protein